MGKWDIRSSREKANAKVDKYTILYPNYKNTFLVWLNVWEQSSSVPFSVSQCWSSFSNLLISTSCFFCIHWITSRMIVSSVHVLMGRPLLFFPYQTCPLEPVRHRDHYKYQSSCHFPVLHFHLQTLPQIWSSIFRSSFFNAPFCLRLIHTVTSEIHTM